MACLLLIVGLVFPRLAILSLLFFSDWLARAFPNLLIPILGLLFLPYTLLWYAVVINVFGGDWGFWQVVFLGLALLTDLSSFGGAASRRRRRH